MNWIKKFINRGEAEEAMMMMIRMMMMIIRRGRRSHDERQGCLKTTGQGNLGVGS